jgi:hypothetical protein
MSPAKLNAEALKLSGGKSHKPSKGHSKRDREDDSD